MQRNNKQFVSFLAIISMLGIWKASGAIFDSPLFQNFGSVAQTTAGGDTIRMAKKQCSLFDQTETDIFMQRSDRHEILFSGCEGFF